MTIDKAIKHLKLIVDNEAYADHFQDVCRTAIEALEKQIDAETEECSSDIDLGKDKTIVSQSKLFELINKLAEYEDLEEQGLLLKPPVKLGQKVFRAYGKEVCEGRIVKMEYNIFTLPRLWVRIEIWSNLYGKMAEYGQADKLLGIEFFLSREEAEQKLKEIEG